jgi:hypothetical protein
MKKMMEVLVLTASLASQSAFAANGSTNDQLASHITPADILLEVGTTQREIEEAMAPIKSMADLNNYLKTTTDSPLRKLGTSARGNFLKSLVFTKDGLGSYSYIELAGLTVTEAYKILSLFGAQSSVSSIPNLKPQNKSEESILTLSSQIYGTESYLRNYQCVVNGDDTDPTHCVYLYGSYCNSACL